jgi:exopolysaccharide biosynthesis polyprenyl glycosylphosphotransferase
VTSAEAAVASAGQLASELGLVVDDRTREILEWRRRRGSRRRGWLVRRALAAADALGLLLAFVIAQWLLGADDSARLDHIDMRTEMLLFAATVPFWVVVAKLYGLYDRDEERTDHSTADDVLGVFHMLTVGTWLFFVGAWATGWADPEVPKLMGFWLLATAVVPTARVAARAYCRRHVMYIQNTIVVGAGDVGQTIARKLLNHPEYGINLVGFVDEDPRARRSDLGHLTLLGAPERLEELVKLFDVERVIVAFSNEPAERTVQMVRELQTMDIQIDVVPRLYELVGPGVGLHTVEGLPVLGLPPARLSRSSALLKRALDLVLTIPGLVALSPLLLAIAIAIKVDDRRAPVFFRQVRMGATGTFRIWKFRTMWADADARKHEFAHLNKHLAPGGDPRMFKIEADPRVTTVGAFLRRYSLDELPQLFNVVAGQMSLVGPRPLVLEEDQHVDDWARTRLTLKPGVTGLWQALGRDAIPFNEMIRLDYLYVTTWTLVGDMRLIIKTLPTLARSSA